jgi:hypothetical protein
MRSSRNIQTPENYKTSLTSNQRLPTPMAVEETGYPAADVARFLGVKRMSVHEAVTRGKTLCAEYALLVAERE